MGNDIVCKMLMIYHDQTTEKHQVEDSVAKVWKIYYQQAITTQSRNTRFNVVRQCVYVHREEGRNIY